VTADDVFVDIYVPSSLSSGFPMMVELYQVRI